MLAQTALVLLALMAGLLGVELLTRLVYGAPRSERLPLVRVAPDAEVGWVMVPGDVHYTYDVLVRLNSLGFRGREVGPKQSREYRILALGDSHIYGQGVADEHLATNLMERQLTDLTTCTVRVINMGVRAYSINQEFGLLVRHARSLNLDHVLLFFYLNDFELVNIRRRWELYKHLDWYTFDFSQKPDADILRQWRRQQILRTSALLMLTHDAVRAWSGRDNFEQRILEGHIEGATVAGVKEYFEQFRRFTLDNAISLTVVVIPHPGQIASQFPNNKYQPTAQALSADLGLQLVDLLPQFKSYYERTRTTPIIPFDGHYNEEGQRVIASGVVQHLQDRSCPRR
jgi:lysophospholipase L1-like esterase